MSVILATWEAEIGRFEIGCQLGQNILRPYLQHNQSNTVWLDMQIPALQVRSLSSNPNPTKNK
jgi:hypothetical protein